MAKAKTRRPWTVAALVAIVAAALAADLLLGSDEDRPAYLFATAERGHIASTVTASGTLRAVTTVEVGSQISGQIKALAADYNTVVRAGEVIARIDPTQFQAKVLQARAELAVAEANVSMQRASLSELEADAEGARAALAETREERNRKQALLARKVVSTSEVDKAIAIHDQANARVKAADAKVRKQAAQIDQALAQVKQEEAVLEQRQIDLDRTIIRSPVDGVVISRNVDIGQTVAASLQAPVLFTIAQDLSNMQVEVSVDEADIGQIIEAQRTTFSVDSFPNRQFVGRIRQIRKAPIEVSNVVTYAVVVSAENADLRLLPGMTANVNIIVGERDDVLKVANSALRFRPAGASRAEAGSGAGPAGGEAARAGAEQRLRGLSEHLGLSDEQRETVRGIFAEAAKKIAAMRDQGLPIEQIRPFVEQLRARNRPRIEAILDARQRERFRTAIALRSSNPVQSGRVWVLDQDGNPAAIEVLYGISDGSVTEIVRGDLAEGAQVIVGIERKRPGESRRRFRFGF